MSGKALVAMSGGVDSSVAAYLTLEAGYEVVGVTMKLFGNEDAAVDGAHTCCSVDDVEDARRVAHRLGIKHYVFNFTDRFRRDVIDRFVAAYEAGMTPNPCVECNRCLKFDELFRRARELGCDRVVTGHYARIGTRRDGGPSLLRAANAAKDQSYVLYPLLGEDLSFVSFPLGDLSKDEVRRIADGLGFANAEKHDSQDICFVPDGDYASFIGRYTGKEYPEGDFVDIDGRVLGRHRGIVRYTVGQRKGLGLALPEPHYVCEVDVKNNRVVLGRDADLFSRELVADRVSAVPGFFDGGARRVGAKIRYRQPERNAAASLCEDGTLRVTFDEPQRAITKGQSVVLYDGDEVVAGGTITGGGNGQPV